MTRLLLKALLLQCCFMLWSNMSANEKSGHLFLLEAGKIKRRRIMQMTLRSMRLLHLQKPHWFSPAQATCLLPWTVCFLLWIPGSSISVAILLSWPPVSNLQTAAPVCFLECSPVLAIPLELGPWEPSCPCLPCCRGNRALTGLLRLRRVLYLV